MKFYSLHPCTNYLQSVANWLVETYSHQLDSVKIFLPNTLLCQFLLRTIRQKLSYQDNQDNFLLPTLIAISNFADHVLGVNFNEKVCTQTNKIEQLLSLTKIVNLKQQFKTSDCLDLATQLNRNFQELADYGIDLDSIELDIFLDKSIYLQQQLQQ